jgi:hypothetical protein
MGAAEARPDRPWGKTGARCGGPTDQLARGRAKHAGYTFRRSPLVVEGLRVFGSGAVRRERGRVIRGSRVLARSAPVGTGCSVIREPAVHSTTSATPSRSGSHSSGPRSTSPCAHSTTAGIRRSRTRPRTACRRRRSWLEPGTRTSRRRSSTSTSPARRSARRPRDSTSARSDPFGQKSSQT